MDDGYVLKSFVLNSIHNGDIEIYVDSYQGWHYLRLLSKKIDKKIKDLPTADVQPIRHGRWINRGWTTICSECGEDYAFAKRSYCPNCGAKMDLEE